MVGHNGDMTHIARLNNRTAPLAERLRPRTLADFVGQRHLVGDAAILADLIAHDTVPSMILWGPPGTGKTTIARIIAAATAADFIQLSAINAGVKDVRAAVAAARAAATEGRRTILFIDEVHRFTKSQQDTFLPAVEDGTITLIGATTENPSFSLNNALLSRCRTFVLEALTPAEIAVILRRALVDTADGLGTRGLQCNDADMLYLATLANGDARAALTALDIAAQRVADGATLMRADLEQGMQRSNLLYDRDGEEHYNIISALHKSMRGGDADAALYWMTRMLAGGEDPLYVARRLIRFASEDVGLANSWALPQAVAAYDACKSIGMPECGVNLAQAVVYMAKSKKSVVLYDAYNAAMRDVRELGNLPVPLHLRNAPTKLMKELDYGKGYAYTPKASAADNAAQTFLPDQLLGKRYVGE